METQKWKQKWETEDTFSLPAFSSIVRLVMAQNNITDKARQFLWWCFNWSKEPIPALILLSAPSCHFTKRLHCTRGEKTRFGESTSTTSSWTLAPCFQPQQQQMHTSGSAGAAPCQLHIAFQSEINLSGCIRRNNSEAKTVNFHNCSVIKKKQNQKQT